MYFKFYSDIASNAIFLYISLDISNLNVSCTNFLFAALFGEKANKIQALCCIKRKKWLKKKLNFKKIENYVKIKQKNSEFCNCSADGNYEVTLITKANVYSNGLVNWVPPAGELA